MLKRTGYMIEFQDKSFRESRSTCAEHLTHGSTNTLVRRTRATDGRVSIVSHSVMTCEMHDPHSSDQQHTQYRRQIHELIFQIPTFFLSGNKTVNVLKLLDVEWVSEIGPLQIDIVVGDRPAMRLSQQQ